MKTNLTIASSSKETGALLQEYLIERGVYSPHGEAMVCYGAPICRRNALNSACGTDKITRMALLQTVGVRTVPWFRAGYSVPASIRFPLLARKTSGCGGKDIVPVFQRQEIPWRIAAGWDWFSEYVPVDKEYRVWAFRGEHLGTYSKEMQRPSDFKYIGRNFRNGFNFVKSPVAPNATINAAVATIKALSLDFAAVDMLLGEDGLVYVLEANTAPGVIASGAQETLGSLADCIAQWVNSGCPKW